MSTLMFFSAISLNVSIEEADESPLGIKKHISLLYKSLQIKELRNLLIFLCLAKVLNPKFGTFSYYYMTEVLKVSQMTYASLSIVAFGFIFVGSMLFNACLSEWEVRRVVCTGILLNFLLAPGAFSLIFRLNKKWNIPDSSLIIFLDTLDDVRDQTFCLLPIMIVYAKIVPRNIEATSFALLTGCSCLFQTGQDIIGSTVNELFVGVTEENMSNYWIL